jgi:nanoRNase/pAp phosphatase (c-di-AMP/oligoRNAs hydrolase)
VKNLCLYHRDCTDGKTAAFVMSLLLSKSDLETEYIGVNYEEPLPDVTDCHVYIVDFSYRPEILKEASYAAKSLTMLDHHLTAAQQWEGYFTSNDIPGIQCPHHITVREDRSGAGLALDYVLSKDPTIYHKRLSTIVAAVQDRDLWLFKISDTKVIFEVLNGLEGDFNTQLHWLVYKCSAKMFKDLIIKATISLELRERLAMDYSQHATLVNYDGYTVPIINIPPNFASRVGEILSEHHPFAILYNIKGNRVNCSMRSKVRTGIDVSALAKKRNGGGHIHASGFRITMEELVTLLNSSI